jgi:hypothetical protein
MVIVSCEVSLIFCLESENANGGLGIGHDRSGSDTYHEGVVCYLESGKKTWWKE